MTLLGLRKHMPSSPPLQIFLMSRDRLGLFQATLSSILRQSDSAFELVVSDNSDGDAIGQWMQANHPSIRYVRRSPPLPALDHFNTVIDQATSEFLVIFHDDDLMETSYVEQMLKKAHTRPEAVAIGCNARYLMGNTLSPTTAMPPHGADRLISNAGDLLEPYLSFSGSHAPPFPGYMYRAQKIKGLILDQGTGGKHADVSFMLSVLTRGPILWSNDVLMRYRVHPDSDSNLESIADRLRLVRHIQARHGISRRTKLLLDYRFSFWLRWWGQSAASWAVHPRRKRTLFWFLLGQGIKMASTRLHFWILLGKKCMRKLRRP